MRRIMRHAAVIAVMVGPLLTLPVTGHAAFDDVNVEDESVIDARERMQEEFDEYDPDRESDLRANPDEVIQVIERRGFGDKAVEVELDPEEARQRQGQERVAALKQEEAGEEDVNKGGFPAPRHYVTMLLAAIAVVVIGRSIPLKSGDSGT